MIVPKAKVRHPEKVNRQDNPIPRKPDWLRVKAPTSTQFHTTRRLVRQYRLHTVCEEASCPNIAECWRHKHATFMLLGAICTRGCTFCNVETGKPLPVDHQEPVRIAQAVVQMGLQHVVITSVDRDDLPDGGAQHFAQTIQEIRKTSPSVTIEVLTPDFMKKQGAIETVVEAAPDVFNHNLETVARLYPSVRPGARYFTSLHLLCHVKELSPKMFTKSGIMVGLGETDEEVYQIMDDLRAADVDFLTIGQYLQPTVKHAAIARFVTPQTFHTFKQRAQGKGFLMVSASPLTRSSYHAGEDFKKLQKTRQEQQNF